MASFTSKVTEGVHPGTLVTSSSSTRFSSSAASASPASGTELGGGATVAVVVCTLVGLLKPLNMLVELPNRPVPDDMLNILGVVVPEEAERKKTGLEAPGSLAELPGLPNKLGVPPNRLAPDALLGVLNKLPEVALAELLEPPNKLDDLSNRLAPDEVPAKRLGVDAPVELSAAPRNKPAVWKLKAQPKELAGGVKVKLLDEPASGKGWEPNKLVGRGSVRVGAAAAATAAAAAAGAAAGASGAAASRGCFAALKASTNCPASSTLPNFNANFSLTCSSSDLSSADQHQILSLLGICLKSQ
mmetsp:Transcript_31518/g.71952  ORF Transcript_31518/g.71952 Transcript_31518/m.71952 type:complete len:301 (-) Transcript_31518:1014-1916(-)